ncbi:Predicted trehalose synthase [Curtobacterium sp. 9128]|uniref:maltokinase N-terminal cap-like domain-containing protein n=1 Tax=Curtobacterium sp. 9128 TaxID=1793722 RepID=UPI0007D728F9|nr:phosphotransferase [Curtobacterium sp. 9128]SBN64765.1 Predicted trehalose synthase [Curtobacterium sp. 9128]
MSDVAQWMARQRWYAAKGGTPNLRTIARTDDATDGAQITTRFVIDDARTGAVLYQVPTTEHAHAVAGLEHARIDTADAEGADAPGAAPDAPGAAPDATTTYDAPHDPAYARWLLAQIDAGAESLTPVGPVRSARVLRGEQSNTSIICETEHSGTVIVKVFRVLHHGDNPDVTTQQALSAAGSSRVPKVFGALHGEWPDVGRADGVASGHLAFAQEFLPGLDDAWRVALDDARRGDSFAAGADRLGAALADVHVTLAGVMPTEAATPARIRTAIDTMHARLEAAAAEVPEIAEHADAVRAVYARAADVAWPPLQRIHGDLHLGQVLSAPEPRGWVFLDFEGEPLRPLHERSLPDVPLRDVAGMLRSFDYVAGALAHDDDPVDAGAWAHEARAAFLDGYERGIGVDLRAHREVLDAFEIDKAVYEVVYEARNRPTWVGIPVAAVTRLAARSAH